MLTQIWNWLKSLFASDSKDPWDLFHPQDRLIYRYFDGTKIRRADPQVLWSKIMNKGPDLFIPLKVADSISKDAPKAKQEVLTIIREIFEVEALGKETGGLNEDETGNLLDHFVEYIDNVKKNLKPPSISSKVTSGNTPISQATNPPISNGLDSGSTVEEKSIDLPIPSPLESVSHSA